MDRPRIPFFGRGQVCHCVGRLGAGRDGVRLRRGDDGCGFAVSRKKIAYNGNGIRVPVHADGLLCGAGAVSLTITSPLMTLYLSLTARKMPVAPWKLGCGRPRTVKGQGTKHTAGNQADPRLDVVTTPNPPVVHPVMFWPQI